MKGRALLLGAAVGLGAWACSSTAPATGQDPLPAEATRTASALATLEVRYDKCQDFHRAAYEAAWRWYGELAVCLGGTPTPEGVGP